ncbi:tetratricopeptide repeat protein [Bdellovibrionota bacterium FG-2]
MKSYSTGFSLTGVRRSVEAAIALSLLFFSLGFGLASAEEDAHEAHLLMSKKKWPEAAIVLKSILKKDPEITSVTVDLARALFYQGRREEALAVLGAAIVREKPAQQKMLVRQSRVLSRTFLKAESFQTFQDGVNFMLLSRFRQAGERLERALAAEPDNVEILTRLGQCSLLDGDADSAAERLRAARRLNPFEPEISLWLGRSLFQRGELELALKELQIAHQELAGAQTPVLWFSEALALSPKPQAELEILEKDLTSNPLHLETSLAKAKFHLRNATPNQIPNLQEVRKDLMTTLGRIEKNVFYDSPRLVGELGFEPAKSSAEFKSEVEKLIQQVEKKIKELSAAS